MKPLKNKRLITFLKALPLIICMILIILFLASGNDITVQTILSYTPESPFAAAMVILLLYALKSVSFVFPIAVLQIAAGHLFQMPAASAAYFLCMGLCNKGVLQCGFCRLPKIDRNDTAFRNICNAVMRYSLCRVKIFFLSGICIAVHKAIQRPALSSRPC